jgi:GNAT superfamily N-acetyltransferase
MELVIREAKELDARAIGTIGVTSWQTAYRGLIPDEYLDALSIDIKEEQLSRSLANQNNRFAIAEVDGKPIGMICFYPLHIEEPIGVKWELEALYIIPQYWNKGIGRALVKYAFQNMITNRACMCSLWVLAGNHRARKFYESMGMTFLGVENSITMGGKELIEVRYGIYF